MRQKDILRDVMTAGGVAGTGEELILSAGSDFTALATKIVAAKADCLCLGTPPEQGASIVIQARMPANTVLLGNTGMDPARHLNAGGTMVEATYLLAEFVPAGVNDMGRAFITNYTKKYNTAPDSSAAVGFSMMLIAGNAIKAAGSNPTRRATRSTAARHCAITCVWGVTTKQSSYVSGPTT